MSRFPRKALIVAGGTGGHIFPGLSVAEALHQQGWQVQWAGNPGAMEGRLVPANGMTLNAVVFSGFRGKGFLKQLLMPVRLISACMQAFRILKKFQPNVVFGLGGYVAFPVGLMAKVLNIPLVIHEQNSVAGLTNKILAKFAKQVLVAFPDALPHAQWVGNPVRTSVLQQAAPTQRFGGRVGPFKVLVLGGSLGAQALNEVVPLSLAMLSAHERPQVVHQAGEKNWAQLVENYRAAGVEAEVVPFIEDVALAMAQADVVICRAGAMTVAEVSALGVAALFVPYPHAVDDHQTTNALFLVGDEAAWMRSQHELTPAWLASWLRALTREVCLNRALKAQVKAKPRAALDVVKHIEQVMQS